MDFWESVFGAKERGYVRIALNTKDKKFNQQFIQWPSERNKLQQIVAAKGRGDLYFSPALFKTEQGSKAAVLGASVGWVDCDTALVETTPQPSIVVESGSPQRTHLYFNLPGLMDPSTIEKYNRYLTNLYNGDPSGWDVNQFLRVPGTLNYKTDPPKQVKLRSLTASVWVPPSLHDLQQETESPLEFEKADLNELLLRENFNPLLRRLLTKHPIECFDRSSGLFHVGAVAAEGGLSDGEIYCLLEYADARWGKFTRRDDKQLRLSEIVRRVRDKRPTLEFTDPIAESVSKSGTGTVSWFDLARSVKRVTWVVEQLVRQNGLTLLFGPTGIGKSSLGLSLLGKVAVGAGNFLGFKVNPAKEQKILYSSLEMDDEELTEFLREMSTELADPRLEEALRTKAVLLPVGHSIPLDLESGQKFYEKILDAGGFTGLIIDTLGASVSTSLSDEKPMRAIADWVDRARKKYGIWIVILHHPRKNLPGRKTELELDDLYGARIIGDRANVVLIMEKVGANVKLTTKKARFGKSGDTITLYRTPTGWIERGANVELDSPLQEAQDKSNNEPEDNLDL